MKLADIRFTHIYLSENGKSLIRGLDDKPNLVEVPPGLMPELNDLLHAIRRHSMDSKKKEFALRRDGVTYRVVDLRTFSGQYWSIRRGVSPVIPLDQLNIHPLYVDRLRQIGKRRGLFIIGGEFGQGKTTTAHAMIREFLTLYGDIAVDLSDPIEIEHQDFYGNAKCFQIEPEHANFEEELKLAMRNQPRYLFISELRSGSTVELAVNAALLGSLVITTAHGSSIIETLLNVMNRASARDPSLFRQALANALCGVMHQSRVAGHAVTKATMLTVPEQISDIIRNKITLGKFEQLNTDIEAQAAELHNQLTSSQRRPTPVGMR